jgi:hypothetical protein
MLYRVNLAQVGFALTMLVVMGTDCIGSHKSNYHTMMATTAPCNSVGLVFKSKEYYTDLRQVGGFLRVLRFPPPIKLTVKHQQTYRATVFTFLLLYLHMYYSHEI